MDIADAPRDSAPSQQYVLRADEVDQAGTAMTVDGTKDAVPLSALPLSRDDSSIPVENRLPGKRPIPARPALRREGSTPPPPPLQPPPPAPDQVPSPDNPTDSLSLPQLRSLVSQFPKTEQKAYTFEYADAESFPVELDEWFQYSEQDRLMLLSAKENFNQRWNEFCRSDSTLEDEISWIAVDDKARKDFCNGLFLDFLDPDILIRIEAIETVFYILAGAWGDTAGFPDSSSTSNDNSCTESDQFKDNAVQISWIRKGAQLVADCSGISSLYKYFRTLIEKKNIQPDTSAEEAQDEQNENALEYAREREMNVTLSAWYFIVESARWQSDHGSGDDLREGIASLEPNFLVFLSDIIANLRWNESSNIPLTRILLLFWKSTLLLFGTTKHLNHAKEVLNPNAEAAPDSGHPILTASPLDYHIFRQEITSKYPAYNPPPPLVPLEPENRSVLPSASTHIIRNNSAGPLAPVDGSGSILHQPVHIATPAPSPPPSPVGPGGKTGKKQNYQTNQFFPFLYPPLDDASNKIGGKGTSVLQDTLVGKRWEGSDVPTSIIEASQLFASRMRMTRSLRQLWRERELFIEHERGWNQDGQNQEALDQSSQKNRDVAEKDQTRNSVNSFDLEEDFKALDPELRSRLKVVEDFYHHAMPNLPSFVFILMKAIFDYVQKLMSKNGGMAGGVPNSNGSNGLPRNKSNISMSQQSTGLSASFASTTGGVPESTSTDDLDNLRLCEISHKAISGLLLIMLKWFKISHILKFEFLTQLLLDTSYVALMLKFFQFQAVDDAIAQQNDRADLSFFRFCHINSDHPPVSPTSTREEESEGNDDAAPPPILRHRRSPTSNSDSHLREQSPSKRDLFNSDSPNNHPAPPLVDELGNPVGPLPTDPISTYSWRNFFTFINLLRITQKITKKKAHRCALIAEYKLSQYIRKGLKIPDPTLRLYTLKLFKCQIPYTNRKWRQSNMRVITAIYLHCRPELRDEWLASTHDTPVDGESGDALPLEQALRALTHWWHQRCYDDVMGKEQDGKGVKMEDRDFFQRELESMGWGVNVGDEAAFAEEAQGAANGVYAGDVEAGGPLHAEGW